MDMDLDALAWPAEGRHEPLGVLAARVRPPVGVLGLYGHVEDRAQTIEGDGVEVVGTPFQGACYLWDPDKRQATAVLTANVEEWVLSSDRQKAGRAMALNTMLKELSETDGFVELKETSFVLPGHTPPEPEYLKDDRTPQWAREDLANLWHLPDILTPLQNSNYISVSVNADRLPHVVRKDRTERAAVGIAMGDLIRMTVAPSLLDCGARRNTIHWCSVDDLRYLIRTVADPEHAADRPPVNRDDPTVTWVEEPRSTTTSPWTRAWHVRSGSTSGPTSTWRPVGSVNWSRNDA